MKRIMLILATAVLLSACVKTPVEPQNIHFSILGDSYSAFEGYIDPATNDPYEYEIIGVTDVEQMWWYKLSVNMGWTMEKNNSFSASPISNFSDFEGGDFYKPNSFLNRMDNLGTPDVILVFGATNDSYYGAPLGDYVYQDWNEDQLCSFRPAMSYLFDGLKRQYPNARIYFMLDMDLCSGGIDEELRDKYIESVHVVSRHYDVPCIDLKNIHKKQWHPDVKGQKMIADQVTDYLQTYY